LLHPDLVAKLIYLRLQVLDLLLQVLFRSGPQ
jgi:hypothetical protein